MAPEDFRGAHLLLCPALGHRRRREALQLLSGGQSSGPDIVRWAERGQLFLLNDPAAPATEGAAAAALTLPLGTGDTVELRRVEAAQAWRDQGVELRIIEEVADALRSFGVRRIVASVADDGLERLKVLSGAGFRMSYVVRDVCPEGRGDGSGVGPVHRDLLWMDLEL